MRSSFLALLVSVVLTVAGSGCTASEPLTVNYTSATNETVYRTTGMRMKIDDYETRSTQRPRFETKVEGDCSGIECRPGRYDMAISVSSPTRVDIGMDELVIRADEERMSWDGPFDLRTGRGFGSHLRSFSVPLKPDQVRTLARAETVELFLGSKSFTLPYDRRKPLRTLLARLDGTE
jgi:hypothetical protein